MMDLDATSAATISNNNICSIPTVIEFDWYQGQEMHASIYIENKLDQVVSYKIKTNTPALYLVKPMEGQIYNKQKAKIIFKRKTLPKQQFQQNILNRSSKQKFQFIFSTSFKDAIGREKTENRAQYMTVKFNPAKKQIQQVKLKRKKTRDQEKTQRQLQQNIYIERGKLLTFKAQRQKQQQKLQKLLNSSEKPTLLNLQNVICLLILAFIFGLII